MRSDHVEASGENANPVVQKARRAHERQAASASGLGPTNQPGMPEWPMQGKRKNGNFGRATARRRGSR